jgi:zinc transport system substrate-binding protein
MSRRACGAALALIVVLTLVCAQRARAAPADGAPAPATSAQPRLRVGVTLHPYYSWTRNVVGDTPVDVVPVLPGEIDAGDYQPRPEDIAKIADLDAIVINGLGHDDFITDMIKASGNAKIVVIRPNDGTPLLKAAHGGSVNSHTFISFSNAIQQTYAIAKALGALRPSLAATFEQNAAQYARRLRAIKASAVGRIGDPRRKRVVTVHDGYGYLMQEFGIGIAGVVEPAHGLVPSAKELGDMVDLLNREHIRVVFSEESFPEPLLKVLREEGHAKVYIISHVASGQYTADKFEIEMQRNADSLVEAMNASDGSGR